MHWADMPTSLPINTEKWLIVHLEPLCVGDHAAVALREDKTVD